MTTNWNVVFETGNVGVSAMQKFVDGELSCETVQKVFRNKYPEASATVRNLIRTNGTQKARVMARHALRRRNLA